jgi:hypothetical protein
MKAQEKDESARERRKLKRKMKAQEKDKSARER